MKYSSINVNAPTTYITGICFADFVVMHHDNLYLFFKDYYFTFMDRPFVRQVRSTRGSVHAL